MKDRLLLVDGSNLLFQMFYGMPARIVNRQGRAIQGTLGFTGALLKIIRRVEPTHAAVLFDGEHENARSAVDPEYKANRPDFSVVPEEDTPFSQLPDVYAALDYLGIRHAETTDCETDDWIAGYVRTARAMSVVIASFDSDFFQLISENVSVLRYRGEKTAVWTPEAVRGRFGIEPGQYADFKALVGDASDNLRGAEKVGPKTAAELLLEFGSLDGVLENAERIRKPSVRESVMRNAERLRRNRTLIGLEGAPALPFSLNELEWRDPGFPTTEILRGIGVRE